MSEWKLTPIKKMGRVVTGKTPPKANPEYFDGEHLFVSPKDLDWDARHITNTQTKITKRALEKFPNQIIPRNSVMYTSLSFAFGKIGIASQSLLTNQQINSVIANEDHDFGFIYYLLRANRPLIFSYNSGIDTPIVPKSVFESIKMQCPPLDVQKKITAVLSAYDDLIENNNRRIALLEKGAEEIYREWFVRLRFPGWETAVFDKGIPAGWEVKKIRDLASTQYGFTAKATSEAIGPKFLRITDIVPSIINWDIVPHCLISDHARAKYLLKEGDIVVARTGATVGYAKRINKLHPSSVFASYLVRLKPNNPVHSKFLGISVESTNFKNFIGMFITGAAQPQANAKIMSLYPLLFPTANLIEKFNDLIEPMFDAKEKLYLRNANLKQSRDMLLSRLISGKLPVDNLNIATTGSLSKAQPQE